MKCDGRKTWLEIPFRLMLALILISAVPFVGLSQTQESDETVDIIVPERAMEYIVRRVLVWNFKPRRKPTVIFIADQRIKQSWLPKIKNIEFRLLSIEEIQRKDLKVHFFTKLALSKNTYDIGFAFGTPNCEYLGQNWHFRNSKKKVRLWLDGGVGGGCSE